MSAKKETGKKEAKKKSASSEDLLVVATNKNARRDYEIVSTFEAGLSLLGSEVKSIRLGEVQLKESYIRVNRGEVFLQGCHIKPYGQARASEISPTRTRKLLLHKHEIVRLEAQTAKKGLTIVPIRMYFKDGRCKLEIGVGRGKKLYDKREDLKKKQADRQIARATSIRRNT